MSTKRKKPQAPLTSEWSRLVDTQTITTTARFITIEASDQERRDLARRFQVTEIKNLTAGITLQREGGNVIHVSGTINADVVQPCSVTGEPVTTKIASPFETWFAEQDHVVMLARAKHERKSRIMDAELPMLEEREDPEPVVDGHIDVGEAAAQFLSLAIDPYPHAEKAEFPVQGEWITGEGEPPPLRRNPFAALKNWKKDRRGS